MAGERGRDGAVMKSGVQTYGVGQKVLKEGEEGGKKKTDWHQVKDKTMGCKTKCTYISNKLKQTGC